jgi:N-acetylneuraminic acid mutarotase
MRGCFLRLFVASVVLAVALLPAVARGNSWFAVSPMAEPRSNQTATLLLDGDVLVAGGYNSSVVGGSTVQLTLAELFDPSSRSWIRAAPMRVARDDAQAALLPDGRVLVIGGYEMPGCCENASTAETYDPPSNTWSSAPAPSGLWRVDTLTALPGGRVLLVGLFGPQSDGAKLGAAVYDPSTDTWSPAATPATESEDSATATLMGNGDVLLAGGLKVEQPPERPVRNKYTVFNTAEEYDPATNTWTTLAPMQQPRTEQAASLLSDGSVLVVGGEGSIQLPGPMTISDRLNSAERYDPATGMWHAVAPMNMARYMQSVTTLPDGRVLVAGGGECSPETDSEACLGYGHPEHLAFGDCCAASSAEIYEPAFNRWTLTEPVTSGIWHTATLLRDGEVLLAGGQLPLASRELSSAYLYGPAAPVASPAAPPAAAPLPVLTHLSQSHRVWRDRRALSGARVRRAVPIGTTFAFILNEPANVELMFTQRLRGYRVSGKCVAHRPRGKRHACSRAKLRGSLGAAAQAGSNKIAFGGVLPHGDRLPAGNYSVTAVASTTTARSFAQTLDFTITR